jgi:hypothetical protein
MPEIEFIQYLPNNLRKRVLVDRPEDIVAKANLLKERGFRLECKNLGDGNVMLGVADPILDFLLASRTAKNGPELTEAVDGLLDDVHAILLERDARHRVPALVH